MLGVLPARATVFQWHHYTFALPPSGIALADSEVCLQAFRLDGQPAWGIQFHAEVTLRDGLGLDRGGSRTTCRCPPTSSAPSRQARIAQSNEQGRALADAFLREASR